MSKKVSAVGKDGPCMDLWMMNADIRMEYYFVLLIELPE